MRTHYDRFETPIISKDEEIRALKELAERLQKQLHKALDEIVRMQDTKRRAS